MIRIIISFTPLLSVLGLLNRPINTFLFDGICKNILGKNYGLDASETKENHSRDAFTLIPNHQYFENLNANIGRNDTGSTCGYVALGMLLTYYDTILNKNIVSSNFDVIGDSTSSYGCLYDDFFNINTHPFVPDYYLFLQQRQSVSLHAKLILINKCAEASLPPTIANTYAEEFGTNIEEVVSAATMYALDYNLSSHLTVVYDSTYYGTTYDELFYFAESELEAERPIMLGGLGHWRIAYGYNQQAFVTHEGYIGDDDYYDNEILKSSFFLQQSITDVVSLHFDYSHHFHSLNYQNSFGQFYCFCGYVHSNTHSYNFDYEYVDSNYHKAYCGCGNYITAYHTFKTNFHNNPCPCGASLWD